MVAGIGTDIVSIDRLKGALERRGPRLLNRLFTGAEQSYCARRRDPYPCLAARFAAKEAVLKALGTGLRGCAWHDVEVLVRPGGAPHVRLSGGAARQARELKVGRVLLSLSHDGGRAVAYALALKTDTI